MPKCVALFVILALAAAAPAGAQTCNVIGSTILCNRFPANSVSAPRILNFHDLSGAEAGRRAFVAGTRAALMGQRADAIALENQRKAAAYRALYRYCGALAYYGPQCLSMVHAQPPRGR